MTEQPVERQPGPPEMEDLTSLAAAVIEGASDAVIVLDRDGVVRLWNDACTALFGWTAQEMVGRAPDVLIPEGRRDELSRVLEGLAGKAEPAALETLRLHKSGDVLPVSCRISPVRGGSGTVVGVSAIVRDRIREDELRRQLELARSLAEARFSQSVIAQATLAPDGAIIEVNPALCRLGGYDDTQLLGRSVLEFLHEDDRSPARVGLELLGSAQVADSQHPQLLRRADGQFVETRVSIFPIRGDAGQVLRMEAVVEDVSATAAAHRELRLREARWRSLETNSADVALFCDPDGTVLFVGRSLKARFGYEPEKSIGARGFDVVHPEDEPGVRAVWAAVAAAPRGTTRVFEARVLHADGSWRWVEQTLTNQLQDPDVGAMVVNITDISERKSAEAVLEELAGSDTLTGLATRAPLMAALDAAFAAGAAASTGLVVFDINRFKLVNDAHGHRAGDDVLAEVALRLVDGLGERGVVARMGGDRFAVMLRDVTGLDHLAGVADELLKHLGRSVFVGSGSVALTASVGAALGPAMDSGALLASAESALDTARTGLAGPVHAVRAESASAALGRARLIEDLGRGIAAGELVVHFQPVVTVAEGHPVAAEALVRWQHPEKGLLTPAAFIAAAEDSGLIIDVGRAVLTAACEAVARWSQQGDAQPALHVAVNLSAKQLIRGDVVEVVRNALAVSGAEPRCLLLEVTESAVMSDLEKAVQTLQALRELGVGIAVDDFGTGYSSLTYLKQFPVTTLKIDRSFVSGLGQSADDAAIVSSVINLARAMQLDCVAEGVETEQQRLVLQALGCAHAQGFLWAPAMDMGTFETWIGRAGREGTGPPPRRRTVSRSVTGVVPARTEDLVGEVSPIILRRVAELSSSGASLHTIAAALNADQLLTGQGKRWTSRSVALLLATTQTS